MDISQFRRIVSCFTDRPADLDISKGTLVAEIRDEIIGAGLRTKMGSVYVTEDGNPEVSAEYWIVHRVARIRDLATRILDYTETENNFITPAADLLASLEDDPNEDSQCVTDSLASLVTSLDSRPSGTCSVMFLTSNAGEGKTTLLNRMAQKQAARFKSGKLDWLVLPVPLGGKTFLRLDDVVVATLMNKYRFQFLYYESFIELVKMGVIVPALDGFEELFIESATGDAITALGNLVSTLGSAGSVLISARRAYFEYKSLQTQSKLYDSLSGTSVSFSRMSLQRWSKNHFMEYAALRGVCDPDSIYSEASSILGEDHPVLTRAVLVRKFLDVEATADRNELLNRLNTSPRQRFDQFVATILEREAREKWILRSSGPARQLLSIEGHKHLLSDIAEEMWTNHTESLSQEMINLVCELYCERESKVPAVTRQIVIKIRDHALIKHVSESRVQRYCFDHEEFFHYFLGLVCHRKVSEGDVTGLRNLLRDRVLPTLSLEIASHYIRKASRTTPNTFLETILELGDHEPRGSCLRENAGGIAIRLADRLNNDYEIKLSRVAFPEDSLLGRCLQNISFLDCYFYPTDLASTSLVNVAFTDCEIERFQVGREGELKNVTIDSQVRCVLATGNDHWFYAPQDVRMVLEGRGFDFPSDSEVATQGESTPPKRELHCTFLRSQEPCGSRRSRHLM